MLRPALVVLVLLAAGACQQALPAQTGEACVDDVDCPDGRCVTARDDARIRYCTAACDGDGFCPEGMYCLEGTCRFPAPSPGALGAMCMAASDCLDQLCVDSMCTLDCAADNVCPDGYVCQAGNGAAICARPPPVEGCSTGAGSGALVIALLLLGLARAQVMRRRATSGR